MPPSLREWLPQDHLAWFVLAAVEEMDLSPFYAAYRQDGHGRAAHDPGMMVAVLLYAYAKGQRSSRGVERECVEDIAFRVIAANQVPDHCTIARFRQRHEAALAGLFARCWRCARRPGSCRLAWGRSMARSCTRTPHTTQRATTIGDPGRGSSSFKFVSEGCKALFEMRADGLLKVQPHSCRDPRAHRAQGLDARAALVE